MMKPETQRCPICEHVSLTREDEDSDYQFICKNPQCYVTAFGANWFLTRTVEDWTVTGVKRGASDGDRTQS